MTDEEMDRRLEEQPELIDRLRAGYSSALDDLLGSVHGRQEACRARRLEAWRAAGFAEDVHEGKTIWRRGMAF